MAEGLIKMNTEALAQLYGDGVDFTKKAQAHADEVVRTIQQLKNSDAFEGNQGEQAREVMTTLSSLMTRFANSTKQLDKFLDDKIGQILQENMKNHYGNVNDKVKSLLQQRLKK